MTIGEILAHYYCGTLLDDQYLHNAAVQVGESFCVTLEDDPFDRPAHHLSVQRDLRDLKAAS
jgi:hypothetical protein